LENWNFELGMHQIAIPAGYPDTFLCPVLVPDSQETRK